MGESQPFLFYPQDFSTVCSTEILALGDVLSAFRVINCEIIAVSVDSHLAHLAWTKTLTATSSNRSAIDPSKIVPLLSDSTHAISKTYGCYLSSAGHSLRAYYIIDKRGYLRSMNVSDIQVGRNLKEILRQVEAFQLVDSTDTQCPVNWTTGQPSVKVAL
ncbi:peroxiredoxin-4 [Diaphorina citri]|uniref:thioredoxin-dependent peroxiredoxin n=1 Tax=Diaphorina citri TaxID=121845 RepID=A0A1S3D282_DIACI|nr:peroxiredoxin-4 [Diaphorina citri]